MITVLASKSGLGWPVRAPALGLYLDLEVRLLEGPVFVGQRYRLDREIVGLSQSRRTESYWTKTTLTDVDTGRPAGEVLIHSGVFKESYPGYPKDRLALSDGEIVASGLAFPEGPVWRDGGLDFTEINGGVVSRWTPGGGVVPVATTGGGPNGAAVGPDGALYVTQNGGMTGAPRVTAGIQRIGPDGEVTMVVTEVAGLTLDRPNDLAFGPDGRAWFTDPRGPADMAKNDLPGRVFVVDFATGQGELVIELGPVFPNGIAFLADGSLVWTESFSRRVMRLADDGPELVIELPERHSPDGLCVGWDGRLYVASTYSHCVSVVEGGEIVERLVCGDGMVTNCCFGGTSLYATESRRGTIWRFDVGQEGLGLAFG